MSKKVKKYAPFLSPSPEISLWKNVYDKKKEEDKKLEEEMAKLKPVAIPTTSATVDTATKEAAKAEEERLKKRKGYKSTILTGPLGITDAAATQKNTLG
jgi:alcohol dehydrogenase class IV